MIQFSRTVHHPRINLRDAVGALPLFWDPTDPRSAIEQHDAGNPPGGPWNKDSSLKWSYDPTSESLKYPGDPALKPLAFAVLPLSRERIVVYPHAWVMILQDDGSFSIDRRD